MGTCTKNRSLSLYLWFFASLSFADFSFAQKFAGKILFVDGSVQILGSDGETLRDGKPATNFYVGDTVITGTSSSTRIRFREGNNEATIGPSSAVFIEKASTEGLVNGTTLKLHYGDLRPYLKIPYTDNGSDSFKVKTPLAEASLKGTSFVAHHDTSIPESSFVAIDGEISVTSNSPFIQNPIKVESGEFVMSNPKLDMSEPAPLHDNKTLMGDVRKMNLLASGKASDVYDSSNVAPWDATTLGRSLAQGPRHKSNNPTTRPSPRIEKPVEDIEEIPITVVESSESLDRAPAAINSGENSQDEEANKKTSGRSVIEKVLVDSLGI